MKTKQTRWLNKLHQFVWKISSKLGPFAPLIAMLLLGLLVLSAARLGLVLWKLERVNNTGKLTQVLLQGIRVDFIQLCILSLVPLLLAPVLATRQLFKAWQKFTYVWVVLAIVLLVFLEAATPGFINEYDIRPNRIFVEYLKYPNEVFSMMWRGFKIDIFAGVGSAVVAFWLAHRYMKPWLGAQPAWSNKKLWTTWPLIFVLAALGMRSSLGHRPANPAMFAITADSMVNSLVLNSGYSVVYATYNLLKETKSSDIYGKMLREEIFKLTGAKEADIPTLTTLHPSHKRDKPLNLVIILQESMGATFVESLGGTPVTPNLEKLKEQGIWFEQLYATGTRSVRGIEAVTAGFAPTPADSTVKLSKSQKNFFTLAALLKQRGYITEFIYGGESHFDNMRSFFTGNGVDHIIEQKDYKNPIFTSSWGVSDEDLLNKTHEQILAHHKSGKPFFTIAFSSSNHAPFEFPDGRVTLYEQPKNTDNNAVKYVDYTIGEFFKKAQQSEYWKDTIFLIVADHDIRVRGVSLVPIKHFHIPALILGADIKPERFTGVASQIDLPVTLLSLMGIEAQHPMTGRDLSSIPPDSPGRAMMQYNANFGWMEQTANGNQVVVLRADKAPAHAIYDAKTKELKEATPPANSKLLEQRALANVLLPDLLYNEQRYRLP
ncbi:LTA synthase family protein [Hydrogenophaga sp.]|jgi:phosphoglycerol transferase MdoB-like AlkP superfamily enzyme|uniref:LTA synthase family protein n=1 Tax=Hydrogenophaga sp. TaxID=1904254 RepID=UPI000BCF5F4B|nr:LTA synthase family protein [Hydrogenophaga sp.]MDP1958991.1 LTA synthase family protein [Methylotenera sp.]OYZ71059.1 MAG: sulfatase [Methylophilaceae bacterium 17-43-7]MDP3885451.1 LTA synthase family protein [Hydrogenophaga sp.]HQS38426.1 LTA synthase family protein [Methylotenera sp.]HQS44396.1 LTA synthase family protein [Methylotenera sp.]